MRVVSWNLAFNTFGAARADAGWRHLAALEPDLALVQEVPVPPAWVSERWDVLRGPYRSWGSAVLARPGLGLRPLEGPFDSRLATDGYLVAGLVDLPGAAGTVVASVHSAVGHATPADLGTLDPVATRAPRRGPPRLNDVAYALLRPRVAGRPFLVGGDWNVSPALWDALHRGEDEASFFRRAGADGWVDLRALFHAAELRTWFRGRDAAYQLDHLFADPGTAARARSFTVDAAVAVEPRLSDHAPVLVELED